MSLGTLLSDAAARFGDRPAIVFEGERTSYAELDRLADAVEAGPPVLPLPMPNVPASVASYHGALRRGSVVVPLNPLLSEREVRQREEAFEPSAGTAVALYTSGTTGEPKRVELGHGMLRANAEYLARDALALREDDVLFASAPLSHVFGMSACMNGAIAAGAALALVARFDGRGALEAIERDGVTVFMGVPAMFVALLAAADEMGRAPQLRLAHSGGAPLAEQTLRAFEDRFGATVLEGYGMTEVGGVAATNHAGRPRKPGSVGQAAVGYELRIADDGEVLVATGDAVVATGDIGRLDDDGYLFLLDRKKDVILRGGYTVYPRELEEVLLEHPCVREVVVVGVPHPLVGEEVAALVVGDGCDPREVQAFVRERVAAYKYPRLVTIVDELPRGPSGKVLRRAIDRAALAALLD